MFQAVINTRGVSARPDHYRTDVDGLRAIAVLPVVLFHAGFGFVSGGFVGVDVFFVISGFLITGIIARDIAERTFSIVEFYRRRALRIFPALTVMALATLIAGCVLLTPRELLGVAKSAASMSVFSSNFYFWRSVSYFQSTAEIRPLLHTWSLAVEEQYYVFFPLLLWFLNKRKGIVAALWVIAVLSLAAAVILVPWKPNAAFYLLPSRAWELMIGGLLAVGALPNVGSRTASFISIAGLALIAATIFTYNAATPFPGVAAVPPVVGAAMLIWAGGGSTIGRALSWEPIVAIGRASYSVYLWHLPILAFAEYLTAGALTTAAKLGLSGASVAFGFASLHFIEKPFRTRGNRNRKAILAAAGMVLLGTLALWIVALRGMPSRLGAEASHISDVADDKMRHHSECMSMDGRKVPPSNACHLGKADAEPTVLLWGDSHALVTATAMEVAANRTGAAFLFAADADCPIGIGFQINAAGYEYCAQYNREMLELALASPGIQTVVLSSRWTKWNVGALANPADFPARPPLLLDRKGRAAAVAENRVIWERSFREVVSKLTSAGKRVVVVGPVPEPSFDVPHRLFVQRFGIADPVEAMPLQTSYNERHRAILAFFQSLDRVTFIWPRAALCHADKCPIIDGKEPVFFDHNHLSLYGARKTAGLYDGLFERSSP